MRIHHATLAKAKKFKITLTIEDNEVVATGPKGERLASGLQGNKVLEEAITKLTGKPAKGAVPKKPAVKTLRGTKPAPFVEDEDEDEDEEGGEQETDEIEAEAADDSDADQGRSIVKSKYKQLYKPHKDKSGDQLSFRINEHVSYEDDETGEMRVSLDALRRFAEANKCWVETYSRLRSRTGGWNAGMARMNVANRLRAKLRKIEKDEGRKVNLDKDVVWK